jgi:excisionase family DNA binding protein
MRLENQKAGARNMSTATQELYSVGEVAKLFSCSKQTVRMWLKTDQLACIRMNQIVRVTRAAIDEFIARNERERAAIA